MNHARRHIVFLLLTLLGLPGIAQFYHFSQYSLEEGLPQSEVYTITEDQWGYIWLGTNGGGLCRFNGKTFDIYNRKKGLHDNIVYSVYHDHNYDLWIGSPRSILRYDGLRFHQVHISDTTYFRDDMRFCESYDGNIWLLSRMADGSRQLFKIENDSLINANTMFKELSDDNRIYYLAQLNRKSIILSTRNGNFDLLEDQLKPSSLLAYSDESIKIPLVADRNKNIWALDIDRFTNNQELHIYRNKKLIKRVTLPQNITAKSVFDSYLDRSGGIWLHIAGVGVIRFFDGQWQVFSKANGLPIQVVRSIHEDAEGNFWFGTLGAGLVRYSGDLFVSFDKESGLTNNIVRSIFQDKAGKYYFGDSEGGLSVYDGQKMHQFDGKHMAGVGSIRAYHELASGSILLGTLTGLFEFDGSQFKACNERFGWSKYFPVLDIVTIRDTFYFATASAGLVKSIHGKAETINRFNSSFNAMEVTDLYVDKKDQIWICSEKGIWLYKNGHITNMKDTYDLDVSYVLQTAEDRFNKLWFATFTHGLAMFDGSSFKTIDSSDGLTSDNIYSVMSDDEGNIWAGTQNGVDKLKIGKNGDVLSIHNYDKYDGFIGIENNGNSNFKDRDGNLWFGTINGAMKHNPSVKRTNFLPPPVYINNIEIGFKTIDWMAEPYISHYDSLTPWLQLPVNLKLPHNENHINFTFDALCYTVPEKTKYQWRLDPLEEDFLPPTQLNQAVYASLPPGDYSFIVKASNNSGIWNHEEPAVFHFTIAPAWWQSMYLKLGIGLALLLSLLLIIQAWKKRSNAFRIEMETLVNAKTKEIRQQKSEIEKKNKQLQEQKLQIEQQAGSISAALADLEKLTDIGKLVTANLSIERIFTLIYNYVSEVMDTYLFGLGLYNEKSKTLDFQNVMLKNDRIPYIKFPIDDTQRLAIYSLINAEEVYINDFYEEYTNYVSEIRPVPGDINSQSVIYIPLKTSEKPFGVLTVQSANKHEYSHYHLNFFRNIANYASIAIENARAFEKLEQQRLSLEKANRNTKSQKIKIEKQRNSLESLNAENNQLLALFTKELQTPLVASLSLMNSVRGVDTSLSPDQKEALRHISEAMWQMNDLINQVVEIKKVDLAAFELQKKNLNLEDVVREITAQYDENLQKKQLQLNWQTEAIDMYSDAEIIEKVISNIFSNAIKFSPRAGTIHISIVKSKSTAELSIRDEGPGLSKEDQERLFSKFQKLSTSPQGDVSAGLGLYIVKKYMDLLNGSISCESAPNKGANFIIRFPMTT
jgi:signal transduction histidine kinase/ligand-binding sensor domain-containing protein